MISSVGMEQELTAIPHHLYLKILRLGFWVGARVWPAQMSEGV